MPDEVEALAHRIGVVNPVVTEHPTFVHVQARQHRHVADDRVHALRLEEGSMGRIVADDEERGDEDRGRHVEGEGPGDVGDEHQGSQDSRIEDQIPDEVRHSLPRRVVVDRLGQDVEDRLQRAAPG